MSAGALPISKPVKQAPLENATLSCINDVGYDPGPFRG